MSTVQAKHLKRVAALAAAGTTLAAAAQTAPAPAVSSAAAPVNPQFDQALADRLGADKRGMNHYVMVILRTGPNRMPAGKERDAMFAGHFANMKRLTEAGKLVMAGPSDGVDGWRGIFVFAVPTVDEARELAKTDPVLINGEMVAEYHQVYLSAALKEMPALHDKVAKEKF